MIETVLACLYLILSIVPFSILRYYPFLKNLRLPLRTVCLLYALILLLELAGMILLRYYGLWSSDIYGLYRLFLAVRTACRPDRLAWPASDGESRGEWP